MKGLKIEGLRKKIANFEIRADFAVAPGERVALLGRSGCGKTSLLRLIAGLDSLSAGAGQMEVDGRDLSRVAAERRNIGIVFQDQALFPSQTVLENAAFGLRVRGADRASREQSALGWLAKVGLAEQARSSIENLSGGERQRLALVRALIWEPSLLLLDEPFSALDQETRKKLMMDLLDLLAVRPIPVLLVTHELSDVEVVSTRRIEVRETDGGSTRWFQD